MCIFLRRKDTTVLIHHVLTLLLHYVCSMFSRTKMCVSQLVQQRQVTTNSKSQFVCFLTPRLRDSGNRHSRKSEVLERVQNCERLCQLSARSVRHTEGTMRPPSKDAGRNPFAWTLSWVLIWLQLCMGESFAQTFRV